MADNPGAAGSGPTTPPRPALPPWWLFALFVIAANLLVSHWFAAGRRQVDLSWSDFESRLDGGQVAEITATGDSIDGTLRAPIERPELGPTVQFHTRRPTFADPNFPARLREHGVAVRAEAPDATSWLGVAIAFGPTILLISAFVWLSRRVGASGSGLFGLGKSRAKRYAGDDQPVTFDDIAGIDEAKHELTELVDFLRNPARYQRLGGTMPKGVLLIGAPGTGKTLLARAIAGEAAVPFFSISASEFVEMIVGVGAARVRAVFAQAREAAPSIIFVDELDAVGRARGASAGIGGHDEREQTLNQILTEMDGFDPRSGVIVLAATNRADVLDPALLRPGRFDRRVIVQHPDRAGREAILAVHTRTVPLDPDVSLAKIAAETPGLVGAELRNLVNEAALRAARNDATAVRTQDFREAMEKVTLGPARHVLLDPADRERTAYHEAGHALLALLVPGADPLHRVSIVPRGMAAGVTWQVPSDERSSYAEDYLRGRITTALGGRAAEQLVYGVATTGAENDLRQVTDIARNMVLRWGMSSKLGPISFLAAPDDRFPPSFQRRPYSDATSQAIDAEVQRIVEGCQRDALGRLAAHRDALDRLARALLDRESLDHDEVTAITRIAAPAVA